VSNVGSFDYNFIETEIFNKLQSELLDKIYCIYWFIVLVTNYKSYRFESQSM